MYKRTILDKCTTVIKALVANLVSRKNCFAFFFKASMLLGKALRASLANPL